MFSGDSIWNLSFSFRAHLVSSVHEVPCLSGGLVVGTTTWGLLVLKVRHTQRCGKRVFLPRHAHPENMFVLPITDVSMTGVKVGTVEVLAPAAFSLLIDDVDSPFRIAVVLKETADPLSVAAREGFRSMNMTHLQMLAQYMKMKFVKKDRPKNEKELIIALVRHCLKDASDQDVANALRARDRKPTVVDDSLLANAENLDFLDTGMDVDEFKEVKKTVKDLVQQRAAAVDKDKSVVKEKPKVVELDVDESSTTKKSWAARPLPTGVEDVSLEVARNFLPRVPGCVLSKDIKRFSRWCAKYPRDAPPCSVSKSWGPMTGETVASSLTVVVKQIWSWHTAATQEECPYTF